MKNLKFILTCLIRFHKGMKRNIKEMIKKINLRVSNAKKTNSKVPFAAVEDRNVKFFDT